MEGVSLVGGMESGAAASEVAWSPNESIVVADKGSFNRCGDGIIGRGAKQFDRDEHKCRYPAKFMERGTLDPS